MSTSFASVLRNSRLASYDRSINQVYVKPKYSKSWGLKRDLPSVVRTKFVTIGALDTAEHQTPWESGESKVLFIKRWKENFPGSKKPTPRAEELTYNIANMTPAEFQRFLHASQRKATEFQQKLAAKEITAEQVYDFLSVDFSEATEKKNGVVGPTYAEHQVEMEYPVEGRILNPTGAGYAIGVGGIVGTMSKRVSVGLRQSGDKGIRTFYVSNAEIDENGKPKVELTLQPKGASSSIPLLKNYEDFIDEPRTFDHAGSNSKFSRNFEQRQGGKFEKRRAKGPEVDDNITANPDHAGLMARIASLLDGSKAPKR